MNINKATTANMSRDDAIAIAAHAAFIMEGLRDNDYGLVVNCWPHGVVGLVNELAEYAQLINELVTAANESRDDSESFPGVLVYEVSSPFGNWLGKSAINCGALPSVDECCNWLANAVIEFFKQDEDELLHKNMALAVKSLAELHAKINRK